MAKLTGASPADNNKFLQSFWFNVPETLEFVDGVLTFYPLQVGPYLTENTALDPPTQPVGHGIEQYVSLYDDGELALTWIFSGPPNSYIGNVGSEETPDDGYFSPRLSISSGASAIVRGAWYHVVISLDISPAAITSTPYSGWVMPDDMLCDAAVFINGSAPGSPVAVGPFVQARWSGSSGGTTLGNGTSWSFNVNGGSLMVAAPWDYPSSATPTPLDGCKVRLAEMQVWFGVSTDIALNIRKFIDARGKPVDPALARAAYGAPYCLFSRNKKNNKLFQTNQGSGGAFTLTGSIADYALGPF